MSSWNNMDLLGMHAVYLLITRQLLQDQNSFCLYETASDLPAHKRNLRAKTGRRFIAMHPEKPYGSQPINPAYLLPEDKPDETGAYIYPYPVFRYLARLAGLTLVSPPDDPQQLLEIQKKYQDPHTLRRDSLVIRNALTQPFYMVNPDKNPELITARVMYTLMPSGEPQIDPLLMPFLAPYFEAYQIEV